MSQKLDDLKRDFEYEFNKFYNNDLKERYQNLTEDYINFRLDEMKFLEKQESTLLQIAREMCNENSNDCSLKSYVYDVESNTFNYNNETITKINDSRDNFFDNIDHSIESHTNGVESNTFDYNNETSTEIMHSIL